MTLVNAVDGQSVRVQLDRLARGRMFFAHRSVGADLLTGIARLAADAGSTLRVWEAAAVVPEGVFAHAWLTADGPVAKLDEFERMLAAGVGRTARIATVKLCYADFTARTDSAQLFRLYARLLRALHAAYPDLTLVHVTVPLVSVAEGVGATRVVRSLLGHIPSAVVENDRREEFNELLRRAYVGREPLFDLARAESTTPDGERVTRDLHGRSVPALARAYTDDGGHLNGEGQHVIARQLVATLADLVEAA